MNTHNIPQKDYLDILFEHRNKDYGAYALRRAYDRRMTIAVGISFGIGLLVALSSFAFRETDTNLEVEYRWVELPEDIILPEKEKPVEAENPKQEVRQQVKTEDFTTIRIEKDDQVKATDLPPVMDSLTTAVIGTEKKQGEADSGIVHTTTQTGDGSGMGPEVEKEPEIFIKAEIDAEFPGGTSAWFRYMSRALNEIWMTCRKTDVPERWWCFLWWIRKDAYLMCGRWDVRRRGWPIAWGRIRNWRK